MNMNVRDITRIKINYLLNVINFYIHDNFYERDTTIV